MASTTDPTGLASRRAALIILLGAFALRVWNLAGPSFWWDEAYSTMVASGGLGSIVASLAREDFHPPLHYVLLHVWMKLAGRSELSLRFLSVGAGVVTVAVAWVAAKRLFRASAAPVAALIVTLSPFFWYYSQENRMYALVPLFGALALYFAARALDERTRWPWGAYLLSVALGLYTFYYAIFTPFVCGLWILLAARNRRDAFIRWAIATLGAFLLYSPWLPIFLSRTDSWASAFTPDNGPAKVLVWTWPELLLGLPSLELYHDFIPAAILGAAALTALVILADSWRSRRSRPGALLAALAFLAPYLAIAAISAVKPVYHPRYAMPVAIGLDLALAGFLDQLLVQPSRAVGRWLGVALVGVLLVGAAIGLSHLLSDPRYARDDYRDAIAYVERGEQPGDVVIDNAIPPFWYYYRGPAPASYFPVGPYTAENVASQLNRIARGNRRIWYVHHLAIPNDPDGFVDTQLRLHSQRQDERWFGPIRIQLWQLRPGEEFGTASWLPTTANVANELALTGYAISGELIGGQTVDVELQWRVLRTPSSDDGFWVGIEDADGRSWGRADARPRDAAYNLSSHWTAGETVITRFDLPVAIGTPPRRFQLVAGVYRLADLAGLNVLDADQHPIGQTIVVGSLGVTRPSRGTTDPSLPNQLNLPAVPGLILAADQVEPTTLSPGDSLHVTLLWRATSPVAPVRAALRLEGADRQLVAEDDRPVGDDFPSERWQTGELVREQRILRLPATTPAGPATLTLAIPGQPAISLGTLTIQSVIRSFTPPPTSHPVQAVLGETIALVGYDLSTTEPRAGDRLTLTLSWRALRTTSTSYHVFVHLLDDQNKIQAQWDGVPKGWTYPTSAWVPGDYVTDTYPLTLSPRTPPGRLTIEVGLYDATTGRRLPVTEATNQSTADATSDRILLGSVQVAPR